MHVIQNYSLKYNRVENIIENGYINSIHFVLGSINISLS